MQWARPPSGRHEAAQPRPAQTPAFPGCNPVRLPRTEINRFEGRLEYWDAATETAGSASPPLPITSARPDLDRRRVSRRLDADSDARRPMDSAAGG